MLLFLAFIYSLNYLDRQIVVILQEPIKADFQLADWELGLMTGGAFGLFYTAMGIPIAHVVDRGVNRVRLIAMFTAAWSIMTAICGLTRNFGQFFVARMGVGLAEAGFAPAAHSLISDLFPLRERSAAAGIFALGVPAGIMSGLALGGVVAQLTDWRTALLIAGVPGILAAIIFPLVAREPKRGGSEPAGHTDQASEPPVSFVEGLRILARHRALVFIIAGSAAISLAQSGITAWLPSFLIRTHDMTLAEVGISLGLLTGLFGGFGTWLGGWQGSRLGGGGMQTMLWLPIAGVLLCAPLYIGALSLGSGQSAMWMLILPTILGALWVAPSIALTQSLAPVTLRARVSAIYIVSANLIGVSLGPLAAGALSDWFASLNDGDPAAGLRQALMCLTLFFPIGAALWFVAGQALRHEAGGRRTPSIITGFSMNRANEVNW